MDTMKYTGNWWVYLFGRRQWWIVALSTFIASINQRHTTRAQTDSHTWYVIEQTFLQAENRKQALWHMHQNETRPNAFRLNSVLIKVFDCAQFMWRNIITTGGRTQQPIALHCIAFIHEIRPNRFVGSFAKVNQPIGQQFIVRPSHHLISVCGFHFNSFHIRLPIR